MANTYNPKAEFGSMFHTTLFSYGLAKRSSPWLKGEINSFLVAVDILTLIGMEICSTKEDNLFAKGTATGLLFWQNIAKNTIRHLVSRVDG